MLLIQMVSASPRLLICLKTQSTEATRHRMRPKRTRTGCWLMAAQHEELCRGKFGSTHNFIVHRYLFLPHFRVQIGFRSFLLWYFFQPYLPKEFCCFIKAKLSHFLSTLINDCQFESSVYSFVHLIFIDFCEYIYYHLS